MSTSSAPGRAPSVQTWVAAGLLACAALLAYANSFQVPLLLDDWITIQENPQLRQVSSLRAALSPPETTGLGGRPVANLCFVLNYALTGDSLRGFHTVNLALHLAAGLVLYGFIRRTLLGRTSGRCHSYEFWRDDLRVVHGPHRGGPSKNDATLGRKCSGLDEARAGIFALAAAALWLVHPLATQSVTYISQRTETLMGFFFLATLYCFVRSLGGARVTLWRFGSVVSCALGMATKEGMVAAPLAVLLCDRCFFSGSFKAALVTRRGFYTALAATWSLLPFLMGGLPARGVGFGLGVDPWDYALIECGAITRYLWLAVWPASLVFDYGFDLRPALPTAYLGAGFVGALIVAAIVGLARRPAWGFLAAWFLLTLAPTSSIVPIPLAPLSENRAYLGSAAVCVAVVALLVRCRAKFLPWFAPAMTVAFIALTSARNADYRSELSIWSDTVAKRPLSPRAHNNLGRALQQIGRVAEAKREFEQALALKSDYADAHANLASALGVLGDHAAALEQARQAIALKPQAAEAHYNFGVALTRLGRLPEAANAVGEAVRLRPGFVEAHTWLASVLLQLNRPTEALREAEASLAIKPQATDARFLLGAALVQLGRFPEAIAAFEGVTHAEPNHVEATYALGTALLQAGRFADAITQFQATLRLKPEHFGAHSNLGLALWQMGKLPEAAAQFEAALRIDPSAAAAQENLQRLRAQMR